MERRRLAFAIWMTLLALPILVMDNIPQTWAGASQSAATDGAREERKAIAAAHLRGAPAPAPAQPVATTVPPAPAPTTAAAPASTTTAPPRTTTTAAPAPTTTAAPPPPEPPPTQPPPVEPPPEAAEEGGASWYRYIDGTCAHKTLPKGTLVTVTNLATGASTSCTVADRGPYVEGRVIDLDDGVFDDLAPLSAGVIDVRITW
ncbi:MAG: septal ring lytic transglycosylase RlpA family protein [Acidimicrobiales bacterium]